MKPDLVTALMSWLGLLLVQLVHERMLLFWFSKANSASIAFVLSGHEFEDSHLTARKKFTGKELNIYGIRSHRVHLKIFTENLKFTILFFFQV